MEFARSNALRQELAYWLARPSPRGSPVPMDFPGGANTEGSARTVSIAPGAEETRALLQDVPAVYRTEINDVLLTALAQTLSDWTGTGRS